MMKKWILIVALFSLALASFVFSQASKAEEKQSNTAARPKTFTITGKITKTMETYIIRQQKPPERFAIMNPNPQVLDTLVKSGQTVTIEAVSVMGDNVNIQKIDGEPYKEEEAIKK